MSIQQPAAMHGGKGSEWRGSAWRFALWGGAALLLLLPAVAMQFTREVAWTALDFAVFGAMLACACGGFELAARATSRWAYRAGAAVAIGAAFLLVWVNLAVGFIGAEGNAANLLFAGVLAVALIGAGLAHFRSAGLALAMLATAAGQALIGVVALLARWEAPVWATALFVALWLGAAALFRKAARDEAAAGTTS